MAPSAFVFFGPCAFPFNQAQIRFCEASQVFRIGTDGFVAAPGFLARTIASSIGDKLPARARPCLEAVTRSEEAPPFGNGHNEASPIATGSKWRACFEPFRRAAMTQSEVFKYGDRDHLLSRRTDKISAENA
jgi:hypothetical protein